MLALNFKPSLSRALSIFPANHAIALLGAKARAENREQQLVHALWIKTVAVTIAWVHAAHPPDKFLSIGQVVFHQRSHDFANERAGGFAG